MSYFIGKTVEMEFDQAVNAITATLKDQGFGIITDIDMSATLKKKINKDIPSYRILGACNPGEAYEAVSIEPQIGVMLPCSVAVRQLEGNKVEISVIDPVASMMAIENDKMVDFAKNVKTKLEAAVANL
jgi:uncharacterized protein (DUF302 family)